MKTAIYIRVSTTQQIDRDSLKTQEERLSQYCNAQNYKIYKIYKDQGISAKDTKRPAFEALMQDIKEKKFETVVVTRLDRVTRSLKDLINLMELFQQHNIKLVSLTESIDTTGPMGRFVINLLGSIAQLEREIDSERVSADMHHRASLGKWTGGVVPLGYTTKGKLIKNYKINGLKEDEALKKANETAPERGRLYVVKKEADLVKKIYSLYLEHNSLRKVTHELNRQNIKSPTNQTWAAVSIRRILTNPTYIGMIWYGKRKTDLSTGKLKKVKTEAWKVVKGEHEPIIKKEMFEQVQKLLKQRYMKPSKAKHPYLLTGLLRCGLCKGGMFGYIYRKSNTKYYLYYRCQNCISKGRTVCKGMIVPANLIEKTVVDAVLSISKNEQFLRDKALLLKTLRQEASPPKEKSEDKKKSLLQEEKKLVEIRDTLLEKLENKVLDDALFSERFNENKRKLEETRGKITEIAVQGHEASLQEMALNASYEELCNLPAKWSDLTDEEKRDKLRIIINQVIVNYDKRAGKANIKLELFVDSISQKKRDKFHSVVIPSRTGMDSWQPQA